MVTRRELILSGTAAVLAVTLPHHAFAADDPAGILTAIYSRAAKGKGDRTIRYDFVHEPGRWKIDEINGVVDGEAWSLRAIITDFLKY
ncbi:hypothetical protein [Bradyrhizobium sp. AZCC 1693]|uniref:hypothetical protein n=1 Tax=Bradyrhizobium sp. AZCC 1693 TaxID=3117029 RepID=UPI002FEFC1EE